MAPHTFCRFSLLATVLVLALVPADAARAGRPAILTDLGGSTAPATALAGVPGALYVAHGAEIRVYDVADPDHPRPLESPPAIGLGAPATRLVAAGNWLAAADRAGGLTVIDISSSSAPVVVGQLDLGTSGARDTVRDIVFDGNRLVALDGEGQLRVVELAAGRAPVEIGRLKASRELEQVTADGNRLYATAVDGRTVLYGLMSMVLVTIDWRDPRAPHEIGAAAIASASGYSGFWPRGIRTVGSDVLVAYGASVSSPFGGFYVGGYLVLDASDPMAVRQIADIDIDDAEKPLPASTIDDFGRVRDQAGIAFLASQQTIRRVDFNDPLKPLFSTPVDPTEQWIIDIARVGDRLYSLDAHSVLAAVDISEPRLLRTIATTATAPRAGAIATADGFAFVAYREAGLGVFDLADPGQPRQTGWLDRHTSEALSVAAGKGLAYTAEGEAGVAVVDVRDPSAPREIATVDTPGRAQDLALADGLAFVADGAAGLQVIDAAAPAGPAVVGSLDLGAEASQVALAGTRAFLVTDRGLHTVDISDPRAPRLDASFEPIYAERIAAADGRLYVDSYTTLTVLDARDLTLLGEYPPTDNIYLQVDVDEIIVEDGFAFIVSDYDGLHVLDARDPARIVAAGKLGTPGVARGVARWGDYLYLADWHWGLRTVRAPVGSRVHSAYLPMVMSSNLALPIRPLTNRAQTALQAGSAQAALSPDGRRLVAVVESYGYVRSVLRLVDVESGEQTEIPFGPNLQTVETPSFTPDGGAIVFAGRHDRWDIFRFDLATRQLDNLTVQLPGPAQNRRPSLSPDGRRLAFDRSEGADAEGAPRPEDIVVMDLGSGALQRLTDHPAVDRFPSFAPDGRKLVFRSERDGQSELYTIGVDGAGLARLTDNPAFDGYPSYSADGRLIAFHSTRSGRDDIFVVDPRTGAVYPVTNGDQPYREPRFAPDGNSLVVTVPSAFLDNFSFWRFPEVFAIDLPRGIGP